jgi:hypothetical protein
MGLGFFLTANGVTHLGEWDGFWTLMSIDTQHKRAWAVLTNSGTTGHNQLNEIDRIVSRAP